MRTIVVFLITLIVVPVTIVCAFSWTTLSIVNKPDYLKKTIKNPNNYQNILDSTADFIKFPEDEKFALSEDEKNRILKSAISPDDLDSTLNDIIDDFYLWLNGNKTFIKPIDLKPHRTQAIEELNAIFKEKYAILPECSQDDLLLVPTGPVMTFPTCRKPTDLPYQSRIANFEPTEISKSMIQDIPEAITFSVPSTMTHLPTYMRFIKLWLYILTIFDILLLTLVILFLRHWPKKLARWIGIPSMIIALPILIPAYFGTDVLFQEITSRIIPGVSSAPKKIQDSLSQIIVTLVNHFASRLNLIAISFLIVGLILVIMSFFLPRYTKNYQPEEDEQEANEDQDDDNKLEKNLKKTKDKNAED